MTVQSKIAPKAKAAAVSAAGGFFLANPLISTFLIGAAAAIYLTLRYRLANRTSYEQRTPGEG